MSEDVAVVGPAVFFRVLLEGLHVRRCKAVRVHGLEFEVVFITGVEDGLVPLGLKDTDTEEERRLFYVGITRARKTLYLIHAAKRRAFGKPTEAGRSPFLDEIPADLVDVQEIKKRKKTRRPVQEGLFE